MKNFLTVNSHIGAYLLSLFLSASVIRGAGT